MNRIIICVFAFVTAAFIARAQTSSGNMMVGGSLEIRSSSRQGGSAGDYSTFGFSPSFGYFVAEDLAVGASLSFGSTRTGTGPGKTVSTAFGFGPFARYYIFTSNEQFGFFGQATLSVSTGKDDPSFGEVTKSNSVSFSVAPGAAYFFNEHWALELSIPGLVVRSRDPNTSADNDKVTEVDFSLRSFSPNIGFRYHF